MKNKKIDKYIKDKRKKYKKIEVRVLKRLNCNFGYKFVMLVSQIDY